MRRAHRLTRTGLATLGVLAGGFLLTATPALAVAPTVVSQSVPSVTPYEARLEATVNAGEEATGCHLQYGKASLSPHPEHEVACEQATIEGGEQGVGVTINGLGKEMLYHYQFVLKNVTSEAKGAEESFTTTTPEKPGLESESSSAVTSTTATLEAQINPDSQKTAYKFEYATNEALTGAKTAAGASELEGYGGHAASAALTGLKVSETYYYRVIAMNGTGTTTDPTIDHFTTVPAPATEVPSPIGTTTATFIGKLTPLNKTVQTEYYFDYSIGEESFCMNEHETPHESAGLGTGAKIVTMAGAGLEPNQKYTVCLVSINAFGGSDEDSVPAHFETKPAPPEIEIVEILEENGTVEKFENETATGVTTSAARLEAQVNPNNQTTTCEFQYGTEESLATSTTVSCESPTIEGFGDRGVGITLTGLQLGTHYYYRVILENATHERTEGEVKPFTTHGIPPIVSTGAFSGLGQSSVKVTGTVTPNGVEGAETYYYYQYGPSTEYGQRTSPGEAGIGVGAGLSPVAAPATLVPLTPGVVYHYRLVAWNEDGTSYGQDETFTAVAGQSPLAVTGPASGVSVNEATISGTINPQGKETSYRFEYGTNTEYGTQAFGTVLPELGVQTVTLSLRGLDPGTTYHYRLLVSSPAGTSIGADQTFTTPGILDPLVNPTTAPLIANPAIAFPTGSGANTGTTTKSLTNGEKLEKALKTCRKEKSKSKKAKCEKAAHKKYPVAKKKK